MLGVGWYQAIYNSCSATTSVLQIRHQEEHPVQIGPVSKNKFQPHDGIYVRPNRRPCTCFQSMLSCFVIPLTLLQTTLHATVKRRQIVLFVLLVLFSLRYIYTSMWIVKCLNKSLFHQRNGSSKNTYNIINKQKKHNKQTQSKHDSYQFSEKHDY